MSYVPVVVLVVATLSAIVFAFLVGRSRGRIEILEEQMSFYGRVRHTFYLANEIQVDSLVRAVERFIFSKEDWTVFQSGYRHVIDNRREKMRRHVERGIEAGIAMPDPELPDSDQEIKDLTRTAMLGLEDPP